MMEPTNNQVSTRTPENIAFEINTIKSQTAQVIIHSSIEIGKRLTEVKSLVPHGQWGTWLEENVEYSQSTADNFMGIAKKYGANPEAIGNLSYTKAVALLSVPTETIEKLSQEHDLEKMSSRDVQKLAQENKRLQKEAAQADAEAARERERTAQIESQIASLKQENETTVKQLQQAIEEAKNQHIDELTAQLQQPVTPEIVEKVPDDVQKKLEQLEKENSLFKSQLVVKYKFAFEQIVKDYQTLLEIVEEVKQTESESYEGLVKSTKGLVQKMVERI